MVTRVNEAVVGDPGGKGLDKAMGRGEGTLTLSPPSLIACLPSLQSSLSCYWEGTQHSLWSVLTLACQVWLQMASSSFDPGEHPQRGYLGRLQEESGVGRQSMVTAALVGGGGQGRG